MAEWGPTYTSTIVARRLSSFPRSPSGEAELRHCPHPGRGRLSRPFRWDMNRVRQTILQFSRAPPRAVENRNIARLTPNFPCKVIPRIGVSLGSRCLDWDSAVPLKKRKIGEPAHLLLDPGDGSTAP